MNISFVIITNGKKPDELSWVLKSIEHQKIKNYEIFISGHLENQEDFSWANYTFVDSKEAADKGNLAEMRNRACEKAQYDLILLLDDDMVLSSTFYEKLLEHGSDFDILTSKVVLPDGTRFWDHCCYQDPKRGHIILEADEDAENLYMSGGMAWIMKKNVFEKLRWDSKTYDYYNMSNLKDYKEGKHNEDTDFAKRCREAGFKIKHYNDMISYHADPSYTGVGRMVRRRKNGRTHEWVKNFDVYFSTKAIAQFASELFNNGDQAEAADVLRFAMKHHYHDYSLSKLWEELEGKLGKTLTDTEWNENGCEMYLKDIELYKKS